jgi:hypothetical protein
MSEVDTPVLFKIDGVAWPRYSERHDMLDGSQPACQVLFRVPLP